MEFAFAEGNPYFTDRLLTKSFFLEDKPEYEDIVYDHSEASEIHWQAGKNVTVVVETRKQRHKATNKTRVIKRTTPRESFFNFFKSVEEYVSVLGGKGRSGEDDEDEEEDEEEHEENMLADRARQEYEIGEHIKNEIVPRAIDWFTGEATADYGDEDYDDDEDDDEFDDEDDEDDEDDDDSESDEDEDDEPKQGKPAKTGAAATGDKPPECKQQ